MRDIEIQIIATAVCRPQKIHEIMELSTADFTDIKLQLLFKELLVLVFSEENIDASLLRLHMQNKGLYEKVGGDKLWAEIMQTYTPVNTGYLVRSMKEKTKARLATAVGQDMAQGKIKPEEALDKIKKINACAVEDLETIETMSEKDLDDLYGMSNAVKSGLDDFDKWNGGFYGGELIVLAARPAIGKSALALQLAKNINDALFVSLEMTKREVYSRLLASVSTVAFWKIRQNLLNPMEAAKVMDSHKMMKNDLRMTFADNIYNIMNIISFIHKVHSKNKIKVVIVDYLQLISGGIGHSKNEQIGDITRRFKTLAIELNIPVIVLSQLNRAATQSATTSLEHLRDSGNIEQDANVVFFLSQKKDTEDVLELHTAKNRNGKANFISELLFDKNLMRISNLERSEF